MTFVPDRERIISEIDAFDEDAPDLGPDEITWHDYAAWKGLDERRAKAKLKRLVAAKRVGTGLRYDSRISRYVNGYWPLGEMNRVVLPLGAGNVVGNNV